jgi:hypothetical protein
MSSRPGEWHLLGVDSDPLPGEPTDVASEVKEYTKAATAIRDQVARLRSIAAGNNQLVGKYAPELADSADDLAGDLDKAQGRFDTVAEQLKIWEPVLDAGRTKTKSYLTQAEHAHATAEANKAPDKAPDPSDTDAVHADKQRATRESNASTELSTIVSNFNTYMDGVRKTAKSVADKIDDASHDKLKNHRFDGLRKWVHDHKDLLKFIADVLTFIATALVIAVLLLSNPAGWMILAAMALTAAAMLIHTTLAAQGDGSWVDVGLDAFALLTMGGGAMAGGLAKAARSTRLVIEGFSEGSTAFSKATAAARTAFKEAGLFSKAGVWLRESNPIARTITGASEYAKAFAATVGRELPEGSTLARLAMGDKEGAELFRDITLLQDKLGEGALLNGAETLLKIKAGSFITGSVVDVTGKIMNDWGPLGHEKSIYPGVEPWVKWKEEHTVSTGASW